MKKSQTTTACKMKRRKRRPTSILSQGLQKKFVTPRVVSRAPRPHPDERVLSVDAGAAVTHNSPRLPSTRHLQNTFVGANHKEENDPPKPFLSRPTNANTTTTKKRRTNKKKSCVGANDATNTCNTVVDADRTILRATRTSSPSATGSSCVSSTKKYQTLCAKDRKQDASPMRQGPPSSKPRSSIEFWGIPNSISSEYRKHGVRQLYKWQVECLATCVNVVAGQQHLIYSAPTSGGKTLIAEILILRRVLQLKCCALFVLPYNSVVAEKTRLAANFEHYILPP